MTKKRSISYQFLNAFTDGNCVLMKQISESYPTALEISGFDKYTQKAYILSCYLNKDPDSYSEECINFLKSLDPTNHYHSIVYSLALNIWNNISDSDKQQIETLLESSSDPAILTRYKISKCLKLYGRIVTGEDTSTTKDEFKKEFDSIQDVVQYIPVTYPDKINRHGVVTSLLNITVYVEPNNIKLIDKLQLFLSNKDSSNQGG